MADYTMLIPLDGSPLAEHSLAYLPALSRLGDVEVHLLSVLDTTEEIHDLSSSDVVERERNVLTAYLHEIAAGIELLHGIKPHTETGVGVPGEVIQKRIDELAPDLLVISTHGRSGVSRWRRGSVAARLLHGSTCPVLLVGPHAAEHGDWREGQAVEAFGSILVPLDGSDLAEHALSTAAAIAQEFGSDIHLVRCVRHPVPGDPATAHGTAEIAHRLQQGATSYLAKIAGRLHGGGEVLTAVRMGQPDVELEEYITAQKIDLVVMTSHGRSGIVRAAMGSVTDRLTGIGRAPVLVVRPPV
jgi:nucleotide-binding universal stress UspA family protein